jgi:hypothetical protein
MSWLCGKTPQPPLSHTFPRPLELHRSHSLYVTDSRYRSGEDVQMTPNSIRRALEEFLQESVGAIIREGCEHLFDLSESKYSISGEHNRCLLHVWSAERNLVRRVLDMGAKNDVLRLSVQRLGQSVPSKLEICRNRDRRTPNARRASRLAYLQKLKRILKRHFSGFTVGELRTSPDLERSFGPIYCRGLLHRGQSAFAVFGVNDRETQSSIDAALTFAILWLDLCRQNLVGRKVVEGLKLFVPARTSIMTRQRMACLHPGAGSWQLYEFDEREDTLSAIDLADRGNLFTRLVPLADESSTRSRFAPAIARILDCMPEAEIVALSPAEIAFRHRGLEFARACLEHDPGSLHTTIDIVFGLGRSQRKLTDSNAAEFLQLIRSIGEARHCDGPRDHPLWRSHPECWLESLVARDISVLDELLESGPVYSQVPAFSAADRAMIDVLALTRSGRLAVIELKADEDVHLPLQGVDYWSRVAWHHAREEFQRFGYFPGRTLSAEPPQLLLVAPAFHIHPGTDTLLRYISPQIDWTLLAIDERWREKVRVVFRKRPAAAEPPAIKAG